VSSLRWIADGIEVAERAGGVVLDQARCPGFVDRTKVKRRSQGDLQISGFPLEVDPDPPEEDD
jgi:hypothetical protein